MDPAKLAERFLQAGIDDPRKSGFGASKAREKV
jgi:hypothetical protein